MIKRPSVWNSLEDKVDKAIFTSLVRRKPPVTVEIDLIR
jgi:hypothetical protein